MGIIKNVLLYWPRFFGELRITWKFYLAARSLESEFEKEGLRVDWIGRIYTVMNLKEEAMQQPELIQQSMIFQELKPVSDILMRHGLSNEAYPAIERLSDRSYLVVLYPDNDYLTWVGFFSNLTFLGILVGLGWFASTFI
jgi:hypothetical protein